VNGFVNAAFGHDKLLMEDGNKWLYKNKEHGNDGTMMSLCISAFVFLHFSHLTV
jgi:26S proteasome regulatory subunit N1